MTPEVEALNAYRIEKDWSFQQLSQAMTNVGCAISRSTLYELCVRNPEGRRHFDRTDFKIRRFLNIIRAREAARNRCTVGG